MNNKTEPKIVKIMEDTEEPIDVHNDAGVSGTQMESESISKLSQADLLIELALEAALFHTSDRMAFADVEINGHRETWEIRGKGFGHWLRQRFFEVSAKAPSSEALKMAIDTIEAKAHFNGPKRDVHIRVAGHDGRLYLDLADDQWRAVEIDETGWRIIDRPPVRFRRSASMLSLPEPAEGGSIEMLRRFLNVSCDDDFVLIVAWLVATLRNRGPYPLIVLSGEQGSAKSTFSKILRSLVDPNQANLRTLPREERDLFIAATNGHVLNFDNVSNLNYWMSDALCRMATGGSYVSRKLYTDQDEVLLNAVRPVVLNGIEDIVNRADLADRAIFLRLEPIPDANRRPEEELWGDFEKARPLILGCLLDAVSVGLRELPNTRLDILPRMADFALWASACEGAFGETGKFILAYNENRAEAVENVIEADPVAIAVRDLLTDQTEWSGTATELLNALTPTVNEKTSRSKSWPANPKSLSGRLRRAAPSLRQVGIDVSRSREGHKGTKIINLTRTQLDRVKLASVASASSVHVEKPVGRNGLSEGSTPTQTPKVDATEETSLDVCVSQNSKEMGYTDNADATDASLIPQPKGWRTLI